MRTCTAQQLADYFTRQVLQGRGQWRVQFDPRDGVAGNLVTPPAGKSLDEDTHVVYIAIRKEKTQ